MSDIKHPAINTVCKGFKECISRGEYSWFCGKNVQQTTTRDNNEKQDCNGKEQGSWILDEDNDALILYPPAKQDFWRKTFYDPILIKDDATFLYHQIPCGENQKHHTITASFSLLGVCQFDQAGIVLRLDEEHWIKTGIEVVDNVPRLSCVVTNVYSDWSTSPWRSYTVDEKSGEKRVFVPSCIIRVHCRGSSFAVEAKGHDGGCSKSEDEGWDFIRIAQMNKDITFPNDPLAGRSAPSSGPSPPKGFLWAGIFAACPEDQRGGHAVFSDFEIVEGSKFDHHA